MFFLVNLVSDMTLLALTGKICALRRSIARISAASAFGALFACAVAALSLPRGLCLPAGVAAVLIAFGREKRITRPILVFFALASAYGGAVYALAARFAVSPALLAAVFAGSYLLLGAVFRNSAAARSGGVAEISVTLGEKTASFRALVDTGNTLRDPIGGGRVLVCPAESVAPLFSPASFAILADGALASDEAVRLLSVCGPARFRLVPYSAVGTSRGLLAAFKPDAVTSDGKKLDGALVAVTPRRISDGGAYSAVIGA